MAVDLIHMILESFYDSECKDLGTQCVGGETK